MSKCNIFIATLRALYLSKKVNWQIHCFSKFQGFVTWPSLAVDFDFGFIYAVPTTKVWNGKWGIEKWVILLMTWCHWLIITVLYEYHCIVIWEYDFPLQALELSMIGTLLVSFDFTFWKVFILTFKWNLDPTALFFFQVAFQVALTLSCWFLWLMAYGLWLT